MCRQADFPPYGADVAEAMAAGQPFDVEYMDLRQGDLARVSGTIEPVLGADDQIREIAVAGSDGSATFIRVSALVSARPS